MLTALVKNALLRTLGLEVRRTGRVPRRIGPSMWPGDAPVAHTQYENDSAFHERYERAQEHTQMGATDNPLRRQRHHTLMQLAAQAMMIPGDICECGCFRGLSAYQIATLMAHRSNQGSFHIFDSFKGLSEYAQVDVPQDREQNVEDVRKLLACPLEQVQQNLSEFSFIKYYKGWIPERFAEVADRRFSFVHIDTDLYQPIWDCLEFFYPRVVGNGIIALDDYGCTQFPGAKKSVDDFLQTHAGQDDFFLSTTSGEAFLIKGQRSSM